MSSPSVSGNRSSRIFLAYATMEFPVSSLQETASLKFRHTSAYTIPSREWACMVLRKRSENPVSQAGISTPATRLSATARPARSIHAWITSISCWFGSVLTCSTGKMNAAVARIVHPRSSAPMLPASAAIRPSTRGSSSSRASASSCRVTGVPSACLKSAKASAVRGTQWVCRACPASCNIAPVSTASCRSRNGVTRFNTRLGFSSSLSMFMTNCFFTWSVVAKGDPALGSLSENPASSHPDHSRCKRAKDRAASGETLTGFLVFML